MIGDIADEVEMMDRHLEILEMVVAQEPIGIVKLSNELAYEHHQVRYSLRILEEENLVKPTNKGAITTDQTIPFLETLDDSLTDISIRLEDRQFER